MRTITQNIYKFSELSDASKRVAVNDYRNIGIDFFDDAEQEYSAQIGALLGISINQIYYSNLGSQEGGASFAGSYKYSASALKEVEEFTSDAVITNIAESLELIHQKYAAEFKCKIYNRRTYDGPSNSSEMNCDVTNTDEFGNAEEDLLICFKEFANWIYEQLAEEWEYQNSYGFIAEQLEINDYEFTENGKEFEYAND